VTAVAVPPAVPVASANPEAEKAPAPDNASVSRALNEPPKESAPSLSGEKSAAN
jgi:hypothetical protein